MAKTLPDQEKIQETHKSYAVSKKSALPIVALVGRPNVGKSTLFNRVTGTHKALVHETEHTTRDLKFGTWDVGHGQYLLVDTCGLGSTDSLAVQTAQQRSLEVIEEAGVVLFMVNAQEGWTEGDAELLQLLRSKGKPFYLICNKADQYGYESVDPSLYTAGEELIPVSGLHGIGLLDIEEKLLATVDPAQAEAIDDGDGAETRLSLVGRPNVGKSTLFNRLVGEARSVVSPEAGTTIDVVEEGFNLGGVRCQLIDTAGARRKKKVNESLEISAVSLAMEAVRRSHYVVFLLDAEEGVTHQDLKIISYAWNRNRSLILVANRIDLAPYGEDWKGKIADQLERMNPQFTEIPLLGMSALTGSKTQKLLPTIEAVMAEARSKFKTSEINKWIERAQTEHPPRLVSKGAKRSRRRPKFYYAVQVRSEPITIRLYCNFPNDLQDNYHRYLIGSFKKFFGIKHVPIAFQFERGREEKEMF
jgi:GTP-binding protein